jgi:hypothetical protein
MVEQLGGAAQLHEAPNSVRVFLFSFFHVALINLN